ncbi:glycerol-3-phosphate dehydrogenase, anaerobic, B subunit [Gleimia coleocanis DSM 15436]|uniref:Glycerol-3-phosphate dehydrogenase, anaerobic, B subunit n=1 Tax=Gleimia coleocanis DSM 15436 TaxID=525245 RepID=C0VYK5_9ACTO|nr:glycerol-3-phosphate dehydrogenase subunit GlpB [Gleimia coleocanis]EEH64508.1 glycerol-3-phosphate dehydrogenase, anaerobic, B subunit [Gleimia coleocanis DSM 15436]
MSSVVVIGAGIAGLTAALRLREAGHHVTLASKGIGGLQLSQGSVDILGYVPLTGDEDCSEGDAQRHARDKRVRNPLEAIDSHPFPVDEITGSHPYDLIGSDAVKRGADYLVEKVGTGLLVGDVARNYYLPTAIGAIRPTALAQPSMVSGDCVAGKKFVIVGIRQIKDFYPQFCAENLNRTDLEDGGRVSARAVHVEFEARAGEVDTSALNFARALEDPAKLEAFAKLVAAQVEEGETVGLPAVLGVAGDGLFEKFQELVGHPVFEIPLPPPSVPGMRLNQKLTQAVKDARIRFMLGTEATGVVADGKKVTHVVVATAGRPREIPVDHVVLAGGGFESGALNLDSYCKITERALDLPVTEAPIEKLIHGDYWGDQQALFKVGVAVDADMRPLDATGERVYDNVHVLGGTIAGAMRWQEKSGEGIALGSMIRATDFILGADND